MPRAALRAGLHSLRDELLRDHDRRRHDVPHGAGGGRDKHGGERFELGEERFSELAGAEVYGGGGGRADDDRGHAAVEAEDAFGLEGFHDCVEGVFVNLCRALGLHLGFDGIEGEEADVSEGAGEAARGGAYEGAVEDGEGFEEGLWVGLWGGPGPFGGGGEGESGGVCEERREIGEV